MRATAYLRTGKKISNLHGTAFGMEYENQPDGDQRTKRICRKTLF